MQGAGERARRKIEKCPLSSLQRMPADQTLLFKINNYLCSCLSSEIFPPPSHKRSSFRCKIFLNAIVFCVFAFKRCCSIGGCRARNRLGRNENPVITPRTHCEAFTSHYFVKISCGANYSSYSEVALVAIIVHRT